MACVMLGCLSGVFADGVSGGEPVGRQSGFSVAGITHGVGRIMKKTVTVTLDVPDDFESFSALERFVRDAGRQWQRDLCEQLTLERGVAGENAECPHCGGSATIGKGSRPRHLKTQLSEVDVSVPRRQCKTCGRSFFL